jgi:hypothetical protein
MVAMIQWEKVIKKEWMRKGKYPEGGRKSWHCDGDRCLSSMEMLRTSET